MGLSSSSTKTQSTSTAAPYSPAQPFIDEGLQATNDVFKAQQPTLAALGDTALQGFNAIAPQAFETSPYVSAAQRSAQSIFDGSRSASPYDSTVSDLASTRGYGGDATLSRLASGSSGNPANGMLTSLYGTSVGSGNGTLSSLASGNAIRAPSGFNPGNAYAGATASGAYLGSNPSASYYNSELNGDFLNKNPYLDSIVQQGTDAATKAVNARFAATGMGEGLSTPYAGLLAKNVADSANTTRAAAYDADRNRQLQAASAADAAYENERGLMSTAAGQLSSNYNANADRGLTASTANANLRLAAASGLNASDQSNISNRIGIANALGSNYQADQATQLAAANGLNASGENAAGLRLSAAQAGYGQQNALTQQQLAALGLTGSLESAKYTGVAPALSLLDEAARAPYYGVSALAGNIDALSGKYGTTTGTGTTTSNQSFGSILGGVAGAGLSGWASGGFKGI